MSLEVLKNALPSLDPLKSAVGMAPTLPKTYKAAVFEKANEKLTIKDVELKQPEEGQVLIKVLAEGICHSDAMVQTGAFGNQL